MIAVRRALLPHVAPVTETTTGVAATTINATATVIAPEIAVAAIDPKIGTAATGQGTEIAIDHATEIAPPETAPPVTETGRPGTRIARDRVRETGLAKKMRNISEGEALFFFVC